MLQPLLSDGYERRTSKWHFSLHHLSTLACEDAYSKLVEVVTVADVCDEDRVGNSLVWKLGFGHKAFVQTFEHFGQDFEVESWSMFWS